MGKWMGGIGLLVLGVVLGVLFGVLLSGWLDDSEVGRVVEERRAEVMGNLASSYVASQTQIDERATVQTVAGLNLIEVAVDQPAENVFRASGVANTFLIRTPEGNVLFDTGLATQAPKHKRLLQEQVEGPVTHIVLSHSHADHMGGTKFWLAEFPDAEVIAHAKFLEGQRYLKDLERHFWSRNRLLYTFMPEEPPESGLVQYGGVQPTRHVPDGDSYRFEVGGVTFEAIPTPGAEGDDNLVLWLPEQQALFTGDFFGPLFPMVPNLFTLRGEKFRDPVAYIRSLDRLIELEPEIILPSHFDPLHGGEQLRADMQAMRDATAYIHDETVAGMNAGKSMWQLMREVQLPPELALSQGHGKVSWNVRSIWEHYSTWFRFESTTELYPVPVRDLYGEIAALTDGPDALVAKAWSKLDAGELEAALHFVEIAQAAQPEHGEASQAELAALEGLLERAYAEGSNYSETGWLKSRIGQVRARMEESL